MRTNMLKREVAFWILLAIAGAATLFIIVLIVWSSARYPFLYVPIASWYVLILCAILAALGGSAAYYRRAWQRSQQPLYKTSQQPTELTVPVVEGHRHVDRAEYLNLVQTLFSPLGVEYVRLQPLSGGYGGSITLQVELRPRREAPPLHRTYVVKLGRRSDIEDEYGRYRRFVQAPLTYRAQFYGKAERADLAVLAFEFAGLDPENGMQTYHDFYHRTSAEATNVIDKIYETLDRDWYQRGRVETSDLFVEYHRLAAKEQRIVEQVAGIVPPDDLYYRLNLSPQVQPYPAVRPAFCPDPDAPWHDPLAFLRTWSQRTLALPIHRATVHGDLNARNILVEVGKGGPQRIWFIDFSHTGNGLSGVQPAAMPADGHTLRDFCRLEADIKFLLTRLQHADELRMAVGFEQALMNCEGRWRDLPATPPLSLSEPFYKAWQVVGAIRRRALAYLADPTDVRPYYIGLLNATLPTLYYQREQFGGESFERQQKRYALLAAGMICARLNS